MIRLGLCCAFQRQPIRFRTTTAAAMLRRSREERLLRLSGTIQDNATALYAALRYCAEHGIGCFRVNSQILPLKTHPRAGYDISELPRSSDLESAFRDCGAFAARHDIRLTFHPDPFVVLNSPQERVRIASRAELEYHAHVAEWIGADVILIHGGGAYGDKPSALRRLADELSNLPARVRSRIALENDDRVFTPADLLAVCEATAVPFVYDVHHHRCLPDELSVEAVTHRAIETWRREPLLHLSSPAGGWSAENPRFHADYVSMRDFPPSWRDLRATIEVEARAKELAVARLRRALAMSTDHPNAVEVRAKDRPLKHVEPSRDLSARERRKADRF